MKKNNKPGFKVMVKKDESLELGPLGSLGVLAYGYIGLRKWREIRDANKGQKNPD